MSIRVHSWFLLSPLIFSCISCVSWLTPDFVHSCPFVVQILPRLHRFVFFVYFVCFVVNPCH